MRARTSCSEAVECLIFVSNVGIINMFLPQTATARAVNTHRGRPRQIIVGNHYRLGRPRGAASVDEGAGHAWPQVVDALLNERVLHFITKLPSKNTICTHAHSDGPASDERSDIRQERPS